MESTLDYLTIKLIALEKENAELKEKLATKEDYENKFNAYDEVVTNNMSTCGKEHLVIADVFMDIPSGNYVYRIEGEVELVSEYCLEYWQGSH